MARIIGKTSLPDPPMEQEWSYNWVRTIRVLWQKLTSIRSFQETLDPASIAANTTAEQTFTVVGLTTLDIVHVNKPTNTAGVGIVNTRVSAVDTLAITFINTTAGAIDPASETYNIIAFRQDLNY